MGEYPANTYVAVFIHIANLDISQDIWWQEASYAQATCTANSDMCKNGMCGTE